MEPKRLRRNVQEGVISGVAAGIAEYFVIDPVIVRIVFVLLGMSGIGFLLYFIFWIMMPVKKIM
ncbi:MAG: PspC domain-containing protein [Bacteroidota bacterium]